MTESGDPLENAIIERGMEWLHNNDKLQFIVDTSIYNDSVLSKVLYWLSDIFIIERYFINEKNQKIILEKKKGIISSKECVELKEKISQDLLDF